MHCSVRPSSDTGAPDQIKDVLHEESRKSSFTSHFLHEEIVKGKFEDQPGRELLGCGDSQENFSENFGMEMLIYPQKYDAMPSDQQEDCDGCPKFDYFRMCDDDLLDAEENTGKLLDGIVSEGTSEHEFIKEAASESSDTIFVDNEHSLPMISMVYSQALEACKLFHVNPQEAILQETGKFGSQAAIKSPQLSYMDESEKTICMRSIESCSETPQCEEKGNKHFEDHSINRVSNGTSLSEPCTEKHNISEGLVSLRPTDEEEDIGKHGIDRGLLSLRSVNKDLLDHEEDTNMDLQGERHGIMERATVSPARQRTEEPEIDELSLISEAVNKPDRVDRGEESKNSDCLPDCSIKMDLETGENQTIGEKQFESGKECFSFTSTFNAAIRLTEERSNEGELLNLKTGVRDCCNLKDGEILGRGTNNSFSCASETGAVRLDRAYSNSNKFNIGDLVWAKVMSHPWWPAQVFDPAYASEFAKKQEQAGKVLIAFFGDRTFAWLQECQLIAFRPNFEKKVKQTNNKTLCKGVAEALEMVCKLAELDSICQHYEGSLHCSSSFSNRQPGDGTLLGSKKVGRRNREAIQPVQTLAFIKRMACDPLGSCKPTVEAAELRGHAYGFRASMVAFREAEFLQHTAVKTHVPYHQKRQYSSIELATETYVEAEESTKKLKNTDVTKNESADYDGGILLALPHNHPKLLTRIGNQRLRKDLHHRLANEPHRESMVHGTDAKLNLGSILSNTSSMKAATNVCGMKKKKSDTQDVFSFPPSEAEENFLEAGMEAMRRKKSDTRDVFSFPPSEAEENFLEAGMEAMRRKKKPPGAEVSRLLKSSQLPTLDRSNCSVGDWQKETMVSSLDLPSCPIGTGEDMSKGKGNGISRVGYSISKIAIELTSPVKCVNKSLKKLSKFRSKKKCSNPQVMGASKCNKAVSQALHKDSGHSGTVQLYQSLKDLARDPLNKAGIHRISRKIQSLLMFHEEFLKRDNTPQGFFDDMGKPVLLSFEDATEETGDPAKNAMENEQILPTQSLIGSYRTAKQGKEIHVEEACNVAENVSQECNNPRSDKNKDPFPRGSTPMASKCRTFNQPNSKKSSVPLHLGIFMQFPQTCILPSHSQLETTFAQFGPVQPSGVSVFEDSASAQVVFAHDEDAEAAYNHAKRTAMFGTSSVTYSLRQYAFKGKWTETCGKVPSLKDEHLAGCLELAASLNQRANDQLRVMNRALLKRPKDAQVNETPSRKRPRNGNIRRSSGQLGDVVQERMMTLLRRVNVIVGTSNTTEDGQ